MLVDVLVNKWHNAVGRAYGPAISLSLLALMRVEGCREGEFTCGFPEAILDILDATIVSC